jgi:ABC-type antimicrobial peptide transport system permease subunit
MISFTVSQRRKEIGIRVAMGANPMQIIRGVFARAAVQLASGLVAGVALALVLDSASGGEVLGQSGRVTLPAVAIVIIVVGLAAAVGPARKGLHIQPTDALRE